MHVIMIYVLICVWECGHVYVVEVRDQFQVLVFAFHIFWSRVSLLFDSYSRLAGSEGSWGSPVSTSSLSLQMSYLASFS